MVVACGVGLWIGYQVGGPEIDEVGYDLTHKGVAQSDETMQATLNTSDQDEWVGFSFELGRVVPDGAAADVLIRRHYWQVPGGAAQLPVGSSIKSAVPADVQWVEDGLTDGFKANPVLLRWYTYSYWTHLLRSKDDVYALRLRADPDRVALVHIESYYCKPEGSGCMTFNYRMVQL
jgi:hypothetical protein